jgi:hypothetical protein
VQLGEPRPVLVGDQQLDGAQGAGELVLDPLGQLRDALSRHGGDEHRSGVAARELGASSVVDEVRLTEHEHARRADRVDLREHLLDRRRHREQLLLVDRGVDDVENQVGETGFLERRAECVDELVRKLADEADGVGHQVVAPAGPQHARGRIERVEQAVANADGSAGERVQQRRLAGIRVARERHRRQVRPLPLGPHRRATGPHAGELSLQGGDPVTREAPVGLDLGLAGTPRPDAAAEPLEMRPQAPHTREVVLELRELDLELSLGAVGVRGKDVENDRRAVDHRHPERVLEVSFLPG